MKSEEVLRYERKQPRGTLEKRLAIVGGRHQKLKLDVMAEISIRIPDNRLVVRYSTKDDGGKMRYVVAESEPEQLITILNSDWGNNRTLNFSLQQDEKRFSGTAYSDPISRSLGKNNAFLDIDGIGHFTYVDIDNPIGWAIPVCVATVLIVITCVLVAPGVDYECTAEVWLEDEDGKTTVHVKAGLTKISDSGPTT